MFVLSGLAMVVGATVSIFITRRLLKQLGGEPDYAAAIAGSIAAGDLTVEVQTKANDHSSLLHAAFRYRGKISGSIYQTNPFQ